jgi:hypothetical protein
MCISAGLVNADSLPHCIRMHTQANMRTYSFFQYYYFDTVRHVKFFFVPPSKSDNNLNAHTPTHGL